MKKRIMYLLLMCITAIVIPVLWGDNTVFAAEKDGFMYIEYDDEVTVCGYVGSKTDIEIPSEINGKKVTGISSWDDNSTEYGYSKAERIVIPKTVTVIFGGTKFESAKEIILPDTPISLYGYALSNCPNLTHITIPQNVTLGYGNFTNCSNLERIDVDNNNPNYCSVDGVLFDKTVSQIRCFPGGKNTSSYKLPKTVTSIAANVFSGCKYLKTAQITNNVNSFESSAFENSGITILCNPDSMISKALKEINEYHTPYKYDLTNCSAALNKTSFSYTGKAILPTVTIKYKGEIVDRSNYSLSCKNNINAGTATVIISGKGEYAGSITKTFSITPALIYRAYVQKKGWLPNQTAIVSTEPISTKTTLAGTTDNLRMETIQMQLKGIGGEIRYRAYVQKKGWVGVNTGTGGWATTSNQSCSAGTKGESKRVEMIQLQTKGAIAAQYDIYYRTYCEGFGWLGWAGNNEKSGSAGYARKLEAFQIQLVPKGASFNKGNTKSFYDINIDGK